MAGVSTRPQFGPDGFGRRVVVTGMGIAAPLGLGVEHVWRRLVEGRSGISAIQSFDVTDIPAKIAGTVPAGTRAEGGLTLSEWVPVKDQKKMDRFIHLAMVAGIEAVEDSGWKPTDVRGRQPHRRHDRVGHRRARDDLRRVGAAARGPRQASVAVLHPVGADQPRLGPSLDQIRLPRPEPRGRHGLRDRRARDRRCRPADHPRRCRRYGGGRCRGCRLRTRHPGVLRLARAVHRLQRHARAGLAAVGRGAATGS